MSQVLLVLSIEPQVAQCVRQAIGTNNQALASLSLEQLRRQLQQVEPSTIVACLDEQLGSQLPAQDFIDRLRDIAGPIPVCLLLAKDCPQPLRQASVQQFEKVLNWPATAEQIKELLKSESDPVSDLASMCTTRPFRALHGRSRSLLTFTPTMFDMIDELKVPAVHDITVLLIGETGSGKTYLARLLHELSPKSEDQCLTVACGALPPDLIESELFGYTRGAFTGANDDKQGKFAAAGNGSLLLDEIDVLSVCQQAKLLRVIETGEYEPVGSNKTQTSKARLIAASNIDLETMVNEGKFRKDLYYRLNVLSFHLLPLRSRPLDVEFLARKFAVDCSRNHGIPLQSITEEFIETLRHYHWPGNIRELENVVRRAVLYCSTGVLTPDTLPSSMKNAVQSMEGSTFAETDFDVSSVKRGMISVGTAESQTIAQQTMVPRTLESQMTRVEKRVIQETLRRHNQHRTATARELGISRVTLYNKMRKFGMLS